MLKYVLGKLKYYYHLQCHRSAWRKHNPHNRTIASTFFPLNKVKVGKHTYGDLHIQSQRDSGEGLEIGNYCSIARGVWFLLGGNHFYRRFSTYPFKSIFIGDHIIETSTKGKIIINDDVWIGIESLIMPGVTIGQGAIVAARSVVTKNVPPYAIVAGNPAHVVKYRFDDKTISQLLSIDFNKISPEFILKNVSVYEKEEKLNELITLIKNQSF